MIRVFYNFTRVESGFWLNALLFWVIVLIATPIWIWGFGEEVFPFMTIVGVLSQFTAAFFALRMGWTGKRIFWSLLLVLIITLGVEYLGSKTGFPFGKYHYTPALQPQVAGVPIIIPLAWFMMLFPAWAIAETILSALRKRLSSSYWIVFAFFSGLVFTSWDLYLDPQMVGRDLWQWDQPGGYFGIPWLNFLGWWLTATIITLVIRPENLPRRPLMIIYTLTWAFQVIGLGLFGGQPAPALVGFVVMGIFVFWGWLLEDKRCNLSSGCWSNIFAAQSRFRY